MPYQYLTDNQAAFLAELVNERFEADAAERQPWRDRFRAIRTHDDIDAMITDLKALPTLRQRQWEAERAARRAAREARQANMPVEAGLYLDKDTGTLYRVSKSSGSRWELTVSVYSNTAARRLTTDNEVVKKGTWKRLSAFDSRRALGTIVRKDMIMTQEEKIEYRTGICNFCYRGLEDAESVARNYGPVCADHHGLPYGGLAEQLAAVSG